MMEEPRKEPLLPCCRLTSHGHTYCLPAPLTSPVPTLLSTKPSLDTSHHNLFRKQESPKHIHAQCAPEPGLHPTEESTKENKRCPCRCLLQGIYNLAHPRGWLTVIREVTRLTRSKSSTTTYREIKQVK